MVTVAQVRKVALGLAGAVEMDHHGRASFRVEKKIFATVPDSEHLNVMVEEPRIEALVRVHPDLCAEVWWGKRLAAVRVDLRKAPAKLVTDLLAEAWHRRVMP